jgi:hypothetical protein
MIREHKPVKLLEWGEGTNTLNQVWTEMGQGKISGPVKRKDGVTTMVVELNGNVEKKNAKDNSVKVAQIGEGMTACSDKWGEVASGTLKSLTNSGGKTIAIVLITNATKVSK